MTTPVNPYTEFADLALRSQLAAADAFETWLGVTQAMTETASAQTKNLRQILHGMFDLVDQGFTVEREIATYLTIASRVAATSADSFREVADLALGTVEAAAQVIARPR